MELISQSSSTLMQSIVLTLLGIYYLGVLISLFHLIFKTDYNLTERLLWMLVLWLLPIFGAIAYWVIWKKRTV